MAGVGVLAAALGAIGVVVPGMPRTVFLIVASYCFTKSCPWLEQRLLRTRLVAPYMRYVDARDPKPRRVRIAAAGAMWTCVSASLAWLSATGRLSTWVATLVVTAALMGTVAIARYGRRAAACTQPSPSMSRQA